MDLDVEQIEKDLHELQQKKEQAHERLRILAPRGRGDRFGRGRGMMGSGYGGRFGSAPGRGVPGPGLRGPGRRGMEEGYQNGHSREQDWDAGPRRMRGGSVAGRGLARGGFGSVRDSFERDQVPAPKKRTLSSAVVVDGEEVIIPGQQDEPSQAPTLKRPAPSEIEENPAMRKRNRRIFGDLLGTLQRFKEEEKAFQKTPTAQKQAEARKRAEEKAAAEGQRLRQMEREKKVAQRQTELDKIRQFNLQADIKALELLYAKKILNRQRCLAFLCTKQIPGLYWLPNTHTPETSAALLEQQDEFEKWKALQQEQLEKEKESLREQAAARKAAALARASRQDTAGSKEAHTAEDDAVEKEEAELEKQLQEQEGDRAGVDGAGEDRDAAGEDKDGDGEGDEQAEPAAMETNENGDEREKGGEGDDGDEGNDADGQDKAPQAVAGSPEGEEDGELPETAGDDEFRGDEGEGAGGDLLDKLEADTGNPDAENIEDLLE